jgi:hypothetical protein
MNYYEGRRLKKRELQLNTGHQCIQHTTYVTGFQPKSREKLNFVQNDERVSGYKRRIPDEGSHKTDF